MSGAACRLRAYHHDMRGIALLVTITLGLGSAAGAQVAWRIEGALGAGHSFGSTLKIEQSGAPPIEIDAAWEGRSFESPLYYAWRVSRDSGPRAWAVRFIHLKAYLENTTPEVERFSVSHGYNLLTLERGFERKGFWLWIGAGIVIGHPESTVRGLTRTENEGGPFGGGYVIRGPTLAVAASRRLAFGGRVGFVAEGRFAWSRARVPIAEGEASVPNTSVHALLGLELRL